MPRNMSYAYTTQQIIDESKFVTRRFGWFFLKPGDRVWVSVINKGTVGLQPIEVTHWREPPKIPSKEALSLA